MDNSRQNLVGLRAPEFPPGLLWLNSDPLTMAGLQGKNAVIVDFWTYSCVNCLRTLPYLKDWHQKYSSYGLIIVGVHSPEFEFEKEIENVKRAAAELGVVWPVVLDSDHKIWQAYGNAWWPRKLLVDKNGFIVHDHIGEGGYAETEQIIQKKLQELSIEEIEFPPPTEDEGQGGICYPTTPEYYLGSARGAVANLPSQLTKPGFAAAKSGFVEFVDSEAHESDKVYLQGVWRQEPEFLRHSRKTEKFEDYLLLKFRAAEVNLVVGSDDGSEIELRLYLNGKTMQQNILGKDIAFDNEQKLSVVKVKEFRMYNLIDSADYLDGAELKILVNSDQFRAYAFTFGGCVVLRKRVR